MTTLFITTWHSELIISNSNVKVLGKIKNLIFPIRNKNAYSRMLSTKPISYLPTPCLDPDPVWLNIKLWFTPRKF